MGKLDLLTITKKCLEQSEEARNSDTKLIYHVYRCYGLKQNAPFEVVLHLIMDGRLPAFASITRAKRKVVELYPYLDCSAKVRELRNEQQENYVAMARVREI